MAAMSVLDVQDDFTLCDQVFGRFCDSCGEIDVDSCTELERIVRLVWHSAGLIENGGFHYLFEGDFRGDPGFVYTAAAYHRIGAVRAYEALQDAFRQFPEGVLPPEVSERLRVYESIPAETWEGIVSRYYGATKDTEACLARFIREHHREYERLLATKKAEPTASPNGGPAQSFGNSGAGGGPPSVS